MIRIWKVAEKSRKTLILRYISEIIVLETENCCYFCKQECQHSLKKVTHFMLVISFSGQFDQYFDKHSYILWLKIPNLWIKAILDVLILSHPQLLYPNYHSLWNVMEPFREQERVHKILLAQLLSLVLAGFRHKTSKMKQYSKVFSKLFKPWDSSQMPTMHHFQLQGQLCRYLRSKSNQPVTSYKIPTNQFNFCWFLISKPWKNDIWSHHSI